jgi:hypothetical protein
MPVVKDRNIKAAPIGVPKRIAKHSEGIRTIIPSAMYPPHYSSNRQAFIKIIRFHRPPPARVLDTTWGAGEFWRDNQGTLYDLVANYQVVGLDIRKRSGQTIQADLRLLPFVPHSFDVVVYDPPFGLGSQINLPQLGMLKGWQAGDLTYSTGLTLKDLMILTRIFNEEAYKTLRPSGLLVTKCQDLARVFVHDLFAVWLSHFTLIDLIVFSASTSNIQSAEMQEVIRQSLKTHSYFQVWEKK